MCRFGSWTYSAFELDITEDVSGGSLQLGNIIYACPSVVMGHETKRNIKYYASVEEPYVDITMSIKLTWR